MLRLITDGTISPEEAVHAYHGVLQAAKIKPKLPLDKDLELTDQAVSYGGDRAARSTVNLSPWRESPPPGTAVAAPPNEGRGDVLADDTARGKLNTGVIESTAWPILPNGAPNFEKMDSSQRRAYHQSRLAQKFR
jgi:hypothetical protein